ncbi:hypothetical protein IMG5_051190 [Ichthyophthirius multifiliis]|uniref:glutamate--tRNA ligase n=1 Tax=Ichthyophthirius multifiliis TaxID=5932 RepID=G0QMQ7_ICHMU|nr:hypothetical protein IMG5_051190 [Ichthyophthirius multifiliis]EGR33496.1 hypothetical protein IMG5_051190 [Ichthyophthirius multifiliis]|eukprot:XP_004037482.1 hypothetical protein IMG5_051190 [Ichthyophthirius multifiliis]
MQKSTNFDIEKEYQKYKNVLKGAKKGEVVTRFPPEPSGYLHIGHAKAVLINYHYSKIYEGKMIFRFDDTNVEKEKEEYVQSIIDDLKTLGVQWTGEITHTSDYFDYLIEKAEELIKKGLAYCDNTPQEIMRDERFKCIESKNRNTPPEENLKIFRAMCKTNADIHDADNYCLRGKIDMKSKNGAMRDPVFYRVNTKEHHRTGTKYRCYPTYDFCCPLVDSIEGVTHAMRTNEYSDRIEQYSWVIKNCDVRPVQIWEFSRLNFAHTFLSKRKLTEFVLSGKVDGWDDPRFPTVKGILRKGLTVEALTEFMLMQGPSKNTNLMEWDKIWAINKQFIDPISGRYTAIAAKTACKAIVVNGPETEESFEVALHPKNAEMGNKQIFKSKDLLIEYDDAKLLKVDQIVTFMKWGNMKVLDIQENQEGTLKLLLEYLPDNKDFKNTIKVNWLANSQLTQVLLVEYDHLLKNDKVLENVPFEEQLNETTKYVTDAIGEPLLKNLIKGQYIQLERRGYFKVDKIHDNQNGDKVIEIIFVPDGKSKGMSTISKNVANR